MKKYIKPIVEVSEVESEVALVTTSIPVKETPADPNIPGEAKQKEEEGTFGNLW